MFSPFAKTTIVKPLREKNDFGVLQKDNGSLVYPFKKSKENIGIYGKQSDLIKSLNEDKKKKFSKIDTAYSKLHTELQEIEKWKLLIEMENKEKNKKIEELSQSTEEQRKIAVNYQLENENLNLQLVEEMQQRSFVSEKLHATKEMYSALKKHFNTLQGHFEYRNRIEDMIKAADNKRCADVENLKEMFNKMQLEQSDRIDYLNCALEAETNKLLDVRERFELKLGEMEHEKEDLCTIVRNLENEIGNLRLQLDTEKNKVQFLEKEKEKLMSDLTEMQNSNKHYDTLLREQKEELKNIEVSREEKEKQLGFQSSIIKDLEAKCEELLETNATFNTEASAVHSLKQANEQLKSEIVELEKRLKEEEDKNFELLSSLQTMQNQNANLEQKISEEVLELEAFKDLQVKYNELNESNAALLNEKAGLETKLKDLSSYLSDLESDKEKLSMLCEENSGLIVNIKKDCEEKLASEANKLNNVKSEYEQLLNELETTKGCLTENSKTLAEVEEKIHEVDTLRTSLTKAEEDLNWQKQSTFNVLKLLQDTEAKYNQDRLAKETEIISYKRQIEKLEFDTKMLKCEVENLEKLESENVKLKENIENLKLEVSDLVRKNDELRSGMRTFGEMCVETTLDTCVEEKKQNAAGYSKEDYPKRSEIQGKQPVIENIISMPPDDKKWDIKSSRRLEQVFDEQAKICDKRVIDAKTRARDLDSSGSECLELVHDEQAKIWDKRVIDPEPRARDLDSSGSECLELVYDEQAKICDKRVIDPKPRARDLDSSGSECLELVYDEKSQEPIGLSTTGTKLGKNKLPATSNAEPKLLPFKTKRKREVQNVTQEDMVRKKFGLPPRKKMGNFHQSPSLKPQLSKNLGKHHDFSNAKVRLENSPWKLTTDLPAPAQRKFFTKRSEERNTPKSSDTSKPWF